MKFIFFFITILSSFNITANEQKYFEFVYVDANTGQSSGGHSAIKFGNNVYHFQFYPDKIFHLVRENFREFRYSYGTLDNRNIYINKIPVSESDFQLLEEKFTDFYIIQTKQLSILNDLEEEIMLLESLESIDQKMKFKTLGYFSQENSNVKLYDSLKEKFTRESMSDKYISIINELNSYKLENPVYLEKPERDKFLFRTSNLKKYIDLIYKKKFYEIISNTYDLETNSYFSLNAKISEKEKKELLSKWNVYSLKLEESILKSMEEDNFENGKILLTKLARFLCIKKSLLENNIYFLDTFPHNSFYIKDSEAKKNGYFTVTRDRIYGIFHQNLSEYLGATSEEDFDLIEDLANRANEFYHNAENQTDIRATYFKMLPEKVSYIRIPDYNLDRNEIKQNKIISKKIYDSYYTNLKNEYPFDLITQNCTSELFRTMERMIGKEESIRILGGYIHGNSFLEFIPFYAYNETSKKYLTKEILTFDSYRINRVKNFHKKENSIIVSLREFNTISSSIYEFNGEDSFFLFFTDDKVLLRPILGLGNLFAGSLQTLLGIGTLPFDKGNNLKKGSRGILFSLPELIFFNIRKGTFVSPTNEEWNATHEKN